MQNNVTMNPTEKLLIKSEKELNKFAKKLKLNFTKPQDFAHGWRECFEWMKQSLVKEQSELEKYKELAGKYQNFAKKAHDLMDHCIDRNFLDNEDLTDGQIEFIDTWKEIAELKKSLGI
jgi:tRNA splicing ligase